MKVPELLLKTLEDLNRESFETFKWYLKQAVLDSCKPIPEARLENAARTDTVSKMINSYGEEMAVNVAITILERMGNNNAAKTLKNEYAASSSSSTSSTSSSSAASAAPVATAAMNAQQGGVIIAPSFAGGQIGTCNITFNKP